jgi:hypothetical protein
MKRNLFLLMALLGTVMFGSCSSDKFSDTEILPEDKRVEYVDNPYVISADEISAKALSFIQGSKSVLRSSNAGSPKRSVVKTENYAVKNNRLSKEKRKEIRQEVPVYTINYKDESGEDAGFAVMAGDERISDNILIFSDESGANIDISARDDAEFLQDLISGYLYTKINLDTIESENVKTRGRAIIDYGNGYVVGPDYAIQFKQSGDPFNRYTPFRNGQRSLAGCTAVAMSEIMAFYEWPLQGAYKRYTTNTATPENVSVSYVLTAAEREGILASNIAYCNAFYPNAMEYIANLITETGYKLNSNYGTGVTAAYPDDVPSVFQQMGYTTNAYQSYSYTAVHDDVETNEIPVFMAGWKNPDDPLVNNNGGTGGHAYVITGIIHAGDGYIYLSIINGNGYYQDENGYYQTAFNNEMFSATNTSAYSRNSAGEIVYPYRYNCHIITNITPNLNNTGSTNPNWRVSSYYPY